MGEAVKEESTRMSEARSRLWSFASATLDVGGVYLSRVFGRTSDNVRQYRDTSIENMELMDSNWQTGAMFRAAVGLIGSVATVAVYWYEGSNGKGNISILM